MDDTGSTKIAKPFLKWVGGKSQLLKEIREYYPFGKGTDITKYAEPFVGGGAVLFDILNSYDLEAVYISDINSELINTYIVIRDEVECLLEILGLYQLEYLKLSNEERKKYYLAKRSEFNRLKMQNLNHGDTNVKLASLMIFLNKTCFNGLYRVNKKGEFNVPVGTYKNPTICDRDNLINVSDRLQNVQIVCGDYKESRNFIDERTFVYFDPPYRPLTPTANFTSYSKELFDDEKQLELAKYVQDMDNRRARIVISNSDPKNVDENDFFFEEAYKGKTIVRVRANRMINSNARRRGKIHELLISNFTKEEL